MNRFLLGLTLAAGLTCMLACLGTKEQEEEPAEEVQAEPELDARHQQRANALVNERHTPETERVDEEPLEFKSMERVGTEPRAALAASEFVMRFVRTKYKARGAFEDPIMKYYPETEEWSAYGLLHGKDPRLPQYAVECFLHLNKANEWECRLIRIDDKQVYAKDIPDPEVTLPNIKDGEGGGAADEEDEPAVADGEDTETEDAAETRERTAEQEAEGDLRMAKSLISRSPAKAKQRLQEIIDRFPETEAAEEARKLIKTVKEQ